MAKKRTILEFVPGTEAVSQHVDGLPGFEPLIQRASEFAGSSILVKERDQVDIAEQRDFSPGQGSKENDLPSARLLELLDNPRDLALQPGSVLYAGSH